MRSLVALALRSGIPVSVWLEEDTATILTAFDLYREEDHGASRPDNPFGDLAKGG